MIYIKAERCGEDAKYTDKFVPVNAAKWDIFA